MSKRSRVGRFRKHRERERSGRTQRSAEQRSFKENRSFALFQRRWLAPLKIPAELWLDHRWADPLGSLWLIGRIEERHYNYGIRYRDTALAYRLTQGLPSGVPKLMGQKGLSHYAVEERVAQAIKHRYLAYRATIIRKAGDQALSLVHTVCANERQLGSQDEESLELFRRGLVALANYRADVGKLVANLKNRVAQPVA